MATLLPERVDLSFVGATAAVGAVLGGLVARLMRDMGMNTDFERAAALGAFWGGVFGLVYVVWDQVEG